MFLIQIQVKVHSFLIYKRNAEETARCQNKQSLMRWYLRVIKYNLQKVKAMTLI